MLGRRTAFGRRNGVFGRLLADQLLAPVLSAVLADSGLPAAEIDDVIIGNAVGGGGNVARLAALAAGLPNRVPGLTIDRQCGSGLEAIVLACRLVAAGAGSAYLAGGVESCSTAPLRAHRLSSTPGHPDFFDRVQFSPDTVGDPDMGVAAENVAERFGIARERQDAFALRSHRLALAAADAGAPAGEIVPIDTDAGPVRADEGPRRSLTEGLLRRFPPVFRPGGTVTAGNSCADADGAVVVLVTSRRIAERLAEASPPTGAPAATCTSSTRRSPAPTRTTSASPAPRPPGWCSSVRALPGQTWHGSSTTRRSPPRCSPRWTSWASRRTG